MLKKFDLTEILNIQNGIILFCVFVIGIMTLLLQKEEQYLKDNRNWLELKKCYSTNYSSLDELTVVNTGMFSDKNRWEVSKLTQNVHSGFFNTYQELAKRAHVAKKYTLKTFTGIPSFKEIFGDRLNISDNEINQFLDQNPGLLSGAANTSEEKRKAVETYLLGTELQEKTKDTGPKSRDRDEPDRHHKPKMESRRIAAKKSASQINESKFDKKFHDLVKKWCK